jgi:hypothetical protein
MKFARLFAGFAVLACVFVSGHTPPTMQLVPESASARLTCEVRLRKLHLVRPDLIGYPIVYEIYC